MESVSSKETLNALKHWEVGFSSKRVQQIGVGFSINPVLDPLVFILLLPWTSKVLPRCQNGFSDVKMEAPRLGDQAPQMATARR